MQENKKEVKKKKCQDTNYVLENFQHKASQGPNYACSSCHRLLFQNQVQPFVLDSYKEKSEGIWRVAKQCISNKYIHECVQSCPQIVHYLHIGYVKHVKRKCKWTNSRTKCC